jgi:heme/copper-type cytochrome/quinol oxidase subunit 3
MSEPVKKLSAAGVGDKGATGVAGTFGMGVLLISLSMLFAASMAALIVARARSAAWPPPGMPRVPSSLWISTVVIVLASGAVQRARNAIRRDKAERLARYLGVTLVIGLLFLAAQTFNWIEFYLAIRRISFSGAYLGMFFVLTGLHAAHVVGGLIPLVVVLRRARRGRYSRAFHPGVGYLAMYWHFLDAVWIVLFGLIYF